jgi:hypothetical protein
MRVPLLGVTRCNTYSYGQALSEKPTQTSVNNRELSARNRVSHTGLNRGACMSMTLEERFWLKARKTDGCWSWAGRLRQGYGQIAVNGKTVSASRASWVIHFGDIPAGMLVCHKCDNPECANPEHLFLGTQKANAEDMVKKGRSGKKGAPRQTKCCHGHPFSRGNTYVLIQKKAGKMYRVRHCRECRKQRYNAWYEAKKKNKGDDPELASNRVRLLQSRRPT